MGDLPPPGNGRKRTASCDRLAVLDTYGKDNATRAPVRLDSTCRGNNYRIEDNTERKNRSDDKGQYAQMRAGSIILGPLHQSLGPDQSKVRDLNRVEKVIPPPKGDPVRPKLRELEMCQTLDRICSLASTTSQVFYVYIDWTEGSNSIASYVGKGDHYRTYKQFERNKYHTKLHANYGWYRQVVLCTTDERFALEEEVRLRRRRNLWVSRLLAWEEPFG